MIPSGFGRYRHPSRLLTMLITWTLVAACSPEDAAAQFMGTKSRHAADAYWETLDDLSAGAVRKAIDGRAEMGTQKELSLACASEVRLSTLERLAKLDPESLLPLAVFESVILLKYMDEKRRYEANETRQEMTLYVEQYLESTDSPARPAVARVTTVLANALLLAYPSAVGWNSPPSWTRHVEDDARHLLQRSLELDPEQTTALHVLAALEERKANHPRAVKYLEQLHRLRPHHAEGRLRLARNLVRTGQSAQAEGFFESNLAETVPGWVQIVSYQEHARLLTSTGRPQEAIALLRQAVDRFPKTERLAVQLSHLIYRHGGENRYFQASEVIENLMGGWHNRTGSTPRARYEAGPLDDLAQLNEAVRLDVESRWPNLADALTELRRRDRGLNQTIYRRCEKPEGER